MSNDEFNFSLTPPYLSINLLPVIINKCDLGSIRVGFGSCYGPINISQEV